MVAEQSNESSATDPLVPAESPEADVSEQLTQSSKATSTSPDAGQESPDTVTDLAADNQEAAAGSGGSDGKTEELAAEDNSQDRSEDESEDELTDTANDSVSDLEEDVAEEDVAEEDVAEEDVAEEDVAEEDVAEEDVAEGEQEAVPAAKDWYILKVQVNREDTIRLALLRRIKIEGLEEHFDEIVVPTEDVVEFNKSGKRKVVRKKLYPGYILVHMAINDDTWFLIRETPGVGDFTGSAGKPTPMDARDVERILKLGVAQEEGGRDLKTSIPFKSGDRVRVKDGHFQNFEGQVDSVDEANGRITVMINIFNRSTPVELEHWQVEFV